MEHKGEAKEDTITSWSKQSQRNWKYLWNLNVKHKVKIFLWKCLNQALPIRQLITTGPNKVIQYADCVERKVRQ